MTEKEFTKNWVARIHSDLLKEFPDEFIADFEHEIFKLPEAPLVLGSQLFGSFEILDLKGNPVFQVDSYYKAKYILYANRTKPDQAPMPKDPEVIKEVVKLYEKHLDSLILDIKSELKQNLPDSKNFLEVTNTIFKSLNIQRY